MVSCTGQITAAPPAAQYVFACRAEQVVCTTSLQCLIMHSTRRHQASTLWLLLPCVRLGAGQRKMSKNQKKKKRGQDAVDEAFAEAEAGLDARARRQQQSAMLEALFEIFFRVLKHCAAASKQQGEPFGCVCFGTAAHMWVPLRAGWLPKSALPDSLHRTAMH